MGKGRKDAILRIGGRQLRLQHSHLLQELVGAVGFDPIDET